MSHFDRSIPRRLPTLAATVIAALLFGGLPASPASAADELAITEVAIGLDGALKVGRWTAVSFRVTGAAGATVDPAVSAPDPDGSETTWKLAPVTLDATGAGQATGLFKAGRLEGLLRITAGNAEALVPMGPEAGVDSPTCRPYSQDTQFIGVLGEAGGVEAAFATTPTAAGGVAARVIAFAGPDSLPTTLDAFDVLDAIILSRRFDLDEQRSAVLADWVRHGGHVVLVLGGDPVAFTSSSLSKWAPIEVRDQVKFTELASLVERVRGSSALSAPGGVQGVRIEAPGSQVLASSFAGPLATRSPYGLGQVTVLALDWSEPQVAQWNGLPGLARYLADIELETGEEDMSTHVELRPTGVSELATQLASQLDHFGTIHRPSYWTVIGFAAAFLLLVGPLDYLLVHRVLKQPRLTWFTFPAWIIFAATAASLGADRLNSTERLANQFDLVDVDATTGLQRVRSWLTVSSPAPRRMRMSSATLPWLAGSGSRQMQITWSGMPESAFGGMYRSGGLNIANPPYTIEAGAQAIENVPIFQWSSKAVVSEWELAKSDGEPLVTSALEDDGTGLLKGTFTHRLPDAITDWCVCYGSGTYYASELTRADRAPSIEPGVPWSPKDQVQRRITRYYLQGQTQTYRSTKGASGGETSVARTEYDPLGLDPFPLARMLTFYDEADGFEYTHGLSNRSLERSDLSRLIHLKRAIVFGRVASAAAEYNIDGSPVQPQERWTYVRLVLPVKPGIAPSLRETGGLKIRN